MKTSAKAPGSHNPKPSAAAGTKVTPQKSTPPSSGRGKDSVSRTPPASKPLAAKTAVTEPQGSALKVARHSRASDATPAPPSNDTRRDAESAEEDAKPLKHAAFAEAPDSHALSGSVRTTHASDPAGWSAAVARALAESTATVSDPVTAIMDLLRNDDAAKTITRCSADRVMLAIGQRAVKISGEKESDNSQGVALDNLLPAIEDAAGNSGLPNKNAHGSMIGPRNGDVDLHALRAFVSLTALRTIEHRVTHPADPYMGVEGAVLFIDISGYSSVTTALESKGPFALSEAVNTYLATVLSIVDDWRGDVLSFAGDAVVVVFSEHGPTTASFALMCADELMRRCGTYEVPGAGGRTFSLHIGVAGGKLRSQVFQRPGAKAMQSSFPFITGQPMIEVGDAVDAAKRGEIALPAELAKQVREHGRIKFESVAIEGSPGMERVVKCESETDLQTEFDGELLLERPEGTEEQLRRFVHPAVYRRLQHTSTATNIAELRFLSVMFIGMLSGDTQTTARDWFSEVSAVLDEHECPVLQVIDDDKGVHVVAAASLVFVDREAASTATVIAKRLQEQEVGCAVGIAAGQVFCGVVGAETACRWDITGPACVRACRLMQLAKLAAAADAGLEERHASVADVQLAVGHSVLADASVYAHADKALLQEAGKASVKGTPDPIALYTLAAVDTRALSLLPQDYMFGTSDAHQEVFEAVFPSTAGDANRQRFAAVLHGPTGCGKATLGLRVCRAADLMVISITCVRGSTTVQVAQGLAQWYRYHRSPVLRQKAVGVLESLEKRHHLKAMRQALDLIDLTVAYGMHTAIIVRAAQFVDEMSLSLCQRALHSDIDLETAVAKGLCSEEQKCMELSGNAFGSGRLGVFYCVTPIFGTAHVEQIAGMGAKAPVVAELSRPINQAEAVDTFCLLGFGASDRMINALNETARGNIEGFNSIRMWLASLRPFISKVDVFGIPTLPPSAECRVRSTSYLTFNPALCSRVLQQVDHLTPELRALVRIVAQGVGHDLGPLPVKVLLSLLRKLQKRAFKEEGLEHDLRELQKLHILAVSAAGEHADRTVDFKHPATRAVLNAMTSPTQAHAIHQVIADVLERSVLDEAASLSPEERDPELPLRLSFHLRRAGRHAEAWRALAAGWKRYLETFPSDSNVCDDFLGTENVYSRVLEQMKEEYSEEVADARLRDKQATANSLVASPSRSGAEAKNDGKPVTPQKSPSKPAGELAPSLSLTSGDLTAEEFAKKTFDGCARMPVHCDFAYEPHTDVPMPVLMAKNLRPSLALGPLMYSIIDFGWVIRTIFFLVSNDREVPSSYTTFLEAHVERYMALVRWYDDLCDDVTRARAVPVHKEGEASGNEAGSGADGESKVEREKKWAAERETVLGFIKPREKFNTAAAEEFIAYVGGVAKPRAQRGQEFALRAAHTEIRAAGVDSARSAQQQQQQQQTHVVYTMALSQLLSPAMKSLALEDDAATLPHVDRAGLCEGLMTLAASNWLPIHPRIGLQFVREQCLWNKTQPMDAFAAFVWFHRELNTWCGSPADAVPKKKELEATVIQPHVTLEGPSISRLVRTVVHCKPRPKLESTPPTGENSGRK